MSGAPAWRAGAGAYALTLAGYWLLDLPVMLPTDRAPTTLREYEAGAEVASPTEPIQLAEGSLQVYDDAPGRRPSRLHVLRRGQVLVPIGGFGSRPGIQLRTGALTRVFQLPSPALLWPLLHEQGLSRQLADGLGAALELQHWALRLSTEHDPMSRLVLLLTAIAEDVGEPTPEGILLKGAPDVRELSALAGVSRESAVINLEWLVHTGVLRRRDGRLWASDLEKLRAAAAGDVR